MPAHRFNGTEWELLYARFYSGAWSDTNDNFWAYDGGQWQLIQPLEAVGPGGLLPPENLTITDLGDHWVEITWTDPVQVTEDPTNVQYRIVEFGTVFTEVVYPTDIFNHEALDPETAYLFEVRYVRREAGEIVASSIVASIPFITLQLPVGEPGVDPGGGPGGSIIPIRPLPGGGPVGGPGCWFEWELFIISLDTLDWITTGITGTHPGDVEDFHYDLATLDPTRVYRFEFCENCDGVMGECNFGPSFNGIADWGADCGGIPASSSAANGIMADAIWAMPEICTIDGKQGLFDRISGTQLSIKKEAQGGGFAFWFTDADGEQAVKANLNGGNVWTVGLAAIETAIQAGQDFTIWYEWRNPDLLPDEGTFAKLAIGISHVFQLVQGPGGWKARIQFSKVGGGFITIESAEYNYDVAWHSMALRWDDDGPKDLFVDGSLAATDSSGVGMAPGSTILNSYVTGLSPGAETRKHYGWARLVSDFDMGQIHEPSITAWWGAAFAGRLLHSKRAAGQGIVKLAGAAGYGGIGGGACVVTVPLGHYYAIAGATGLSNPPNDVQLGAETWGFGGAGGSTDNGGPSQYHGGGRSDLRSGADRGTSVVIAPGGGASSNQFGGGAGGFPKGFPLTSTGGGFSGYNGVGGTETAGGAGGAGYAGGNTGSTGDNTAQGASGIGSGGRGGFGNYSFGQGGPGGGGGGGKHGGGGGAGANGSSDNGRGGGGGSGDTTGASSVIRTADGVNQGHGVVAMQVLAEYGDATKDFIDEHHPAVYVPCEEAAEEGCVVVTDVISGKGFWDREVAPLFAGAVGGRSDYSLQGNSLYLGRGAIYVWRTFQTHDFTMTEQDAVGVPWNPPVLNAGESWAIEWTQWSIAGATVYGPGTLDTGVDNFAAASSGVRPWFVWANATQVGISVATTAMGTIQSAVGNGFASRATNSVTRYGVSYNAATDTFHFYRADNEHHTMTRTTAGVPTTGKFNEKDWRPNLCSAHTNNDQSRIQDVAVFDYHRTQTMFQDGADALAVGAALSVTDATGGTIQRNGDYIEHTFTANGTFTPTTTKTCEVLIVGGGGGSGGGQTGVYYGAGGAGGEVNSFSGQVISAPVAITIGAGGTNQTVDATAGGVGGTTTAAGIGSAAGGEAGGADGMGHGGDNADYPGSTPPGGTAGGGGGGAGGPGSGSNGGPGLEWPAGSGRLWGSGGNGGPSGSRGAGESGAGSGSGSYSGRVVIRYPA